MEFKDYWDNRGQRQNTSLKSVMHNPKDNEKQINDIIDFFNIYKTSVESVLDYGCGIGRLSKPLNEIFDEYIGVDFSESMIDIAKDRNPDLNYKVLNTYFDIPSYDMIFIFTVLLHIPPEEIEIFSKQIKNKFKYIFIAEHMDDWATKKFQEGFDNTNRTWCFNRPLWYYEKILGFKTLYIKDYKTSYEKSDISFVIGEFL